MGQGNYIMFGYGIENMPEISSDISEELYNMEFDIRFPYEGTSNYLVVPLAVTDGFLQDIWKLPDIPYGVIDELEFPNIEQAKKEWGKIQNWFQKKGISLSNGKVLLLGDYD